MSTKRFCTTAPASLFFLVVLSWLFAIPAWASGLAPTAKVQQVMANDCDGCLLDGVKYDGVSLTISFCSCDEKTITVSFCPSRLKLYQFDDGEQVVLGASESNSGKCAVKLLYRLTDNTLSLMLSGDQELGLQHVADFDLRASREDIVSLLEAASNNGEWTRDDALKIIGSNRDLNSSGCFEVQSAAYGVVEAGMGERRAPSFQGYTKLIQDLNAQKIVNLSNYAVEPNYFKTPGWHHGGSRTSALHAVSVCTVPNGNGRNLFQIVLMDIREDNVINTGNSAHGYASLAMYYAGGCIGEYDAVTGVCTVKFINQGLSVNNAAVGLGKLTNGACFKDASGSLRTKGTAGAELLRLISSPGSFIPGVIDVMTACKTGSSTLYDVFGGRSQQIEKGSIVRNIGMKQTGGLMNEAGSDIFSGHMISILGNIEKPSKDVDCSWEWEYKYNCLSDL